MTWKPAGRWTQPRTTGTGRTTQVELGQQAEGGVPGPRREHADQLLDVPPVDPEVGPSCEPDADPTPTTSGLDDSARLRDLTDSRTTMTPEPTTPRRPRTGRSGSPSSSGWTPTGSERLMQDEFPEDAAEWLDPVSRRQFLTLMGASAGPGRGRRVQPVRPAGLPAEDRPVRPAAGRRSPPASRCSSPPPCPARRRRPRAARPQPRGPADQGRGQPGPPRQPRRRPTSTPRRRILDLYDPDRSKADPQPERRHRPSSTAVDALRDELDKQRAKQGAGAPRPHRADHLADPRRPASTSSSAGYPKAKWVQYEPVGRDNAREGRPAGVRPAGQRRLRLHQGRRRPVARLPTSSAPAPAGVRYARDFMANGGRSARSRPALKPRRRRRRRAAEPAVRRRVDADHAPGRSPTTGCRCKPSEVEAFARALAAKLGVAGVPAAGRPAGAGQAVDRPARRRTCNAQQGHGRRRRRRHTSRRPSTPSPTPSTRSSGPSARRSVHRAGRAAAGRRPTPAPAWPSLTANSSTR